MLLFLFGLGSKVSEIDLGRALYREKCSVCHDAGNPLIPPLYMYRIKPAYVLKILEEGVPGSSMPSFKDLSFKEKKALALFVSEMQKRENLKIDVPDDLVRRGEMVYYDVCSSCHGDDGRGKTFGEEVPPPPDFTQFNPLPERTLEVLNEGIPGTAMYSFKDILTEEDKRAVAVYLLTFFEE